MKMFNWEWSKFIVGIATGKMPNIDLIECPFVAIHLGFMTIIICPTWNITKADLAQ